MSTVALVPVVPGENAAGQPTVPDTASATTSFADLLDDSQAPKQKTHKAETTHRAYSFAELGMFGLHDLVLPPDPKQKDATAGKSDAKLAAVTPTAATSKAATASTSSAPQPLVYVPFLQTESNAGNTVMGVTLPGGGSTGLSGITGIRSFAGGSTIDQVKPLRQTAPSPADSQSTKMDMRQTPAKTPEPVSVTVGGPDQALEIAVRSGGEPTPEVTKLRRLIETTVASFEMDIAQLHVNGSAIENVFSLGGGMNGGSAR